MPKEKPLLLGARIYKRHRAILKRLAKRLDVSEAEVVRRALDAFAKGV
jgi:hypothetical protein